MTVLAIDTCFAGVGVGLAREGHVLDEMLSTAPSSASIGLLPQVELILERCQLAKEDISGLAVTVGPGFFTGLRIGLATVQGLALAWDVPVAGVSSLRLLAEGLDKPATPVWVCADARRGFLYAAAFTPTPQGLARLSEDAAVTAERLASLLEPPALLVGAGARMHAQELLRPGLSLAPDWADTPRPGLLALLGEHRLAQGLGVHPEELKPRYCRPSEAEVRFGLPLDEYNLLT